MEQDEDGNDLLERVELEEKGSQGQNCYNSPIRR